MTPEEFVYSTLTGAAGVTAIVGAGADARIYPDEAKEGAALPLIVYERQQSEMTHTVHGALAVTRTTVAVTCWADKRSAAEALCDAVQTALRTADAWAVDRDGQYETETEAYGAVVAVEVWT